MKNIALPENDWNVLITMLFRDILKNTLYNILSLSSVLMHAKNIVWNQFQANQTTPFGQFISTTDITHALSVGKIINSLASG